MPTSPGLVAILAYDGLCTFEFGIAVEVFGLTRPEFDFPWYTHAIAAVDQGPMRAMGGMMTAMGVKPEIEAFDLSHILKAKEMWDKGQIADRPYVQFVMGVKNAMPVDRHVFDYYIQTVHRLFGADAPWCAAGIGPAQIVLNDWAVSSGGHARTGLEDNVRLDKSTLAPSNAALVRRVVDLCAKYERPVANCRQARQILGLAAPQ